ncbi:putative DNA-binding pseudobarrel domain superfamily [Helianthus anomalus]
MKVTPYPRCEQKFVMLTSISTFVEKNILSLSVILLMIIQLKVWGTMKVFVNSWNWFDVSIEKDSLSKCYFFTHGWKKIVRHLGLNNECVVVIRYLFLLQLSFNCL